MSTNRLIKSLVLVPCPLPNLLTRLVSIKGVILPWAKLLYIPIVIIMLQRPTLLTSPRRNSPPWTRPWSAGHAVSSKDASRWPLMQSAVLLNKHVLYRCMCVIVFEFAQKKMILVIFKLNLIYSDVATI